MNCRWNSIHNINIELRLYRKLTMTTALFKLWKWHRHFANLCTQHKVYHILGTEECVPMQKWYLLPYNLTMQCRWLHCSRAWMCLARHWSTGSILAGCPSCRHQWLICVPAGTEPRPLGASLLTLPLSHGNSLQSYNATKHVYTRGSQNIGCVFLWTRYRVELCCINRTYWRCTCCIQLVDRHVSIKYT